MGWRFHAGSTHPGAAASGTLTLARQAVFKAATTDRIPSELHDTLHGRSSRSLRDPRACSGPAGWVRSTARGTRGSAAKWRSRCSGPASRRRRTSALASSRRPRRPGRSTTRTFSSSTTSARTRGAPYIVSELLEGETLRGPMPAARCHRARPSRRARDRPRARGRAREGDRPPRPEAGERLRDAGRRG